MEWATFGALIYLAGLWMGRMMILADIEDRVNRKVNDEINRILDDFNRSASVVLEEVAEERRQQREKSLLN